MLYKLLLLINLFSITSTCLPSATNDEATVPITESPGGSTTKASSGTTAASSGTTTASSGTTISSSGTTIASFGAIIALSDITSTVATTTTTSNPFAGCQFNTLTDAQRDTVVQIHNNFRSMLANGQAAQPSGNLQPGKNIYKLKYNCALENMAQVIANSCTFTVFRSDNANCMVNTCSSQNNSGSTGVNEYTSNAIDSTDAALQSSTSAWWDQLRTNGKFNTANPVFFIDSFTIAGGITGFGPPTYDFAQMAWADTITVGCGVGHCAANPTLVVCYYATGGSIEGQNIYQVGAPCSGCTTFAGSTFDSASGLCVAPDANYQNPF